MNKRSISASRRQIVCPKDQERDMSDLIVVDSIRRMRPTSPLEAQQPEEGVSDRSGRCGRRRPRRRRQGASEAKHEPDHRRSHVRPPSGSLWGGLVGCSFLNPLAVSPRRRIARVPVRFPARLSITGSTRLHQVARNTIPNNSRRSSSWCARCSGKVWPNSPACAAAY